MLKLHAAIGSRVHPVLIGSENDVMEMSCDFTKYGVLYYDLILRYAVLKMADIVLHRRRRNQFRRNRVFRDRRNPFDLLTDEEFYQKFRFRRIDVINLVDEVVDSIQISNRAGVIVTPVVCF